MKQCSGLRVPPPRLLRRAAAGLAAGLLLGGCAPSPVAFHGSTDVRSVEVTVAEVPPVEVYYHRNQPPGVLGYLGTAAFMASNVYRAIADSQKTQKLRTRIHGLQPREEIIGPFLDELRRAGVFRRVARRGADRLGGPPPDAVIEIEVERWGPTYASEEELSAQVVVVGRMRPVRAEKLLWRRKIVETDGARATFDKLTADAEALASALRRALRAAGADLARDLAAGLKPQHLLPPEL
ncbi:MAG: hypothetical protein V3R38_02060 [bacterium]